MSLGDESGQDFGARMAEKQCPIAFPGESSYNKMIAGKVFAQDAEGSDSPPIRRSAGFMRMRKHFRDSFDPQGRHTRRNLLSLPSVLYRQAASC